MTNFEAVGQFMKTFGQEVKTEPEMPDAETCHLRLELISEEVNELYDALMDAGDQNPEADARPLIMKAMERLDITQKELYYIYKTFKNFSRV